MPYNLCKDNVTQQNIQLKRNLVFYYFYALQKI